MVVCAVDEADAELVAVKVTVYVPSCAAAGVHESTPAAGSKLAPLGRFAAERVIGNPPGSAAEIVRLSGLPPITACVAGAVRTGADAGWTVSGLLTVVLPN